jgi:hypothetical protein
MALLFMAGCRKDNEPSVNQRVDSYYYGYMDYPLYGTYGNPLSVRPNFEADNLVKFEYNGGKIVKRIGGLLYVSPGSGYDLMFSSDRSLELTYKGSQITIASYIYGQTSAANDQIIFKNTHNQMVKKVVRPYDAVRIDTIAYTYNSSGFLIQSINERHYLHDNFIVTETSLYYYNGNNNLDSIVSRVFDEEGEFIWDKQVAIFNNYDNSPNPLKDLIIFDDIFYRSLSRNNYSSYALFQYNAIGKWIKRESRSWTFIYDKDGNIDFDKY